MLAGRQTFCMRILYDILHLFSGLRLEKALWTYLQWQSQTTHSAVCAKFSTLSTLCRAWLLQECCVSYAECCLQAKDREREHILAMECQLRVLCQ